MALYQVPATDADILLDLHHLHHRPQQLQYPASRPPEDLRWGGLDPSRGCSMEQVYDGPSTRGTAFSHHSSSSSSINIDRSVDRNIDRTDRPVAIPRHAHSLSLGQVPFTRSHLGRTPDGSYSHSSPTTDASLLAAALPPPHHAPAASPYLSAPSSAGDSAPTSRTQTVSPAIGHPQTSAAPTPYDGQQHLQDLHSHVGSIHQHYSAGLGLVGIPSPAGSAGSAGAVYTHPGSSLPPASAAYMHAIPHPETAQYAAHQHMHGAVTPPSPSTAHASSVFHSISDDHGLPYTPHSYASSASSLPSSYHAFAGSSKHVYDSAHSLPAVLPSHHFNHHPHHSLSQSTSYHHPHYPVSHSAQGYMTVYTVSPMYGCKDSQVNLEVGIAPHEPHYIRGFRVLFGTHGTTTRVIGESRTPSGEERVELAAVTPPVHLTHRIPANGTTCQLSLQALDEGGNVADWADLGIFEFTDIASPIKGHKRPGSPLSSIRDSPSSSIRPAFPDQSPYGSTHRRGHSRGSSIGSLVNGFGYMSHHSSHSRNSSMASNLGDYELQMQQQSPQTQGIALSDSLTNASGVSGSIAGHGAHQGPASTIWYPTPEGEIIERKPIARLRAPVQPPSSTPASSNLRHPPMEPATENTPTLYRTSQLPTTGPDGNSNVATKAQLKFDSDLNNMALGWSHEEWHAKRRLVHFTRSQEGGTITSSFAPISLQDITPNTIVISCIFREDKNECYVTSVDTIYLLEALVSVRFTVEEKNRIRRNLEGYKPLTVTKAKQDCEEFFKVIMSFPNPKPRNIEKDVKVFPWKILSNALKKIISKYSASYLKPEEMVGPGNLPPQPIGWPPGRSPPAPPSIPLATSGQSPIMRHHATVSGGGPWMPPPNAPGTSGSATSSINMSPMMRNDMKISGPPLSSNGGHHRPSTLGSVAEDEPISKTINGGRDQEDQTYGNSHIPPGYPASQQPQQQPYDAPDESDQLSTPIAHDGSAVGVEHERNAYRFS